MGHLTHMLPASDPSQTPSFPNAATAHQLYQWAAGRKSLIGVNRHPLPTCMSGRPLVSLCGRSMAAGRPPIFIFGLFAFQTPPRSLFFPLRSLLICRFSVSCLSSLPSRPRLLVLPSVGTMPITAGPRLGAISVLRNVATPSSSQPARFAS